MADDLEFWRFETVKAKVGLSRSEIYRRIKAGTFPSSRPYPGTAIKKFWLSSEIREWQRDVLASTAFEDLLK